MSEKWPTVLVWAARTSVVGLVLLLLTFVAGEFINPHSGPPSHPREWIGFALIFAFVSSLAVGWRRPVWGGTASLSALAAFCFVVGMHNAGAIIIAAVPGVLMLLTAVVRTPLPRH